MPLSRITAAAKKMRLSRKQEKQEDKEERLSSQRERTSLQRSSETEAERQERLSSERERSARRRRAEDETQRQERLASDCERSARRRSVEDEAQQQERLLSQRERSAATRRSETEEQHKHRILDIHSRVTASRRAETPEEHQYRLSKLHDQRAMQTEEQHREQLQKRHLRESFLPVAQEHAFFVQEPSLQAPQPMEEAQFTDADIDLQNVPPPDIVEMGETQDRIIENPQAVRDRGRGTVPIHERGKGRSSVQHIAHSEREIASVGLPKIGQPSTSAISVAPESQNSRIHIPQPMGGRGRGTTPIHTRGKGRSRGQDRIDIPQPIGGRGRTTVSLHANVKGRGHIQDAGYSARLTVPGGLQQLTSSMPHQDRDIGSVIFHEHAPEEPEEYRDHNPIEQGERNQDAAVEIEEEIHQQQVPPYQDAAAEENRQQQAPPYQDYMARYATIEDFRAAKLLLRRELSDPGAALRYNPNIDYSINARVGLFSHTCTECGARLFYKETQMFCCSNGAFKVDRLEEPEQPLYELFQGNSNESKYFLNHIVEYNTCFQLTSMGIPKPVHFEGLQRVFAVQGQIYHRIGSLLPVQNENEKFMQLYFIDNEEREVRARQNIVDGLHEHTIRKIQAALHDHNHFIRNFVYHMQQNYALRELQEFNIVIQADKVPYGHHPGRYNAPVPNDIAAVVTDMEHGSRDIVIQHRGAGLQHISTLNHAYDGLQYPLIYTKGESGYCCQPVQQGNRKVTCKGFYNHRFMVREGTLNHLLRSGQLLNRFAVDQFSKIEAERLRFIQNNQSKLKVDAYIHLQDAVNNDAVIDTDVGRLVILPSTFIGSPRYMHERTQDAMTYVRELGTPDLFITFTCNPTWPEIQQSMFQDQKSWLRHDIISRVFHIKIILLIDYLKKLKVFGNVSCHMYSVEWQQRGLPHTHILLWLTEKLRADQIDQVISAEIPSIQEDPELFEIVRKNMIHGPCYGNNDNLPCMKNKVCTKKYPRSFISETQTGNDGYPLYRRRSPEEGGAMATVRRNNQDKEVDNRWVVPYSPLLLKAFNAHINVEFCHSVKAIKYICKYINKGCDMATYALENRGRDEISNYQSGRYLSTNEAFWRIFGYEIHKNDPPVIKLHVHLPGGQRIYYKPGELPEALAAQRDSTLMAFFILCTQDDFAKTLLYNEVPKFYTWDKSGRRWHRAKQGRRLERPAGIIKRNVMVRVYTVHPSQQECFFVRMLLHEVRGPTSFVALRTFEGRVYHTFREACHARGLLESDEHWNSALEEASVSDMPSHVRNLFAVMVVHCQISRPSELWVTHRNSMSEDFLHRYRNYYRQPDANYNDAIYNRALIEIENKINSLGGKSMEDYELPTPNRRQQDAENIPRLIQQELNYDTDSLENFVNANGRKLNIDQAEAFTKIMRSVQNHSGHLYFLDAPGGTGKTFLLNIILAATRSQNSIALAVASSGIAATLLEGGKTAHSTFKLPFNLRQIEAPTCYITKNSALAELLRQTSLIIWDESTMSHKRAFEALDRTLRDIRNNESIMGQITLVMSGDFRQILPVIPKGSRADAVQASVKNSNLWTNVQRLSLSKNMRAELNRDQDSETFADKLLMLGEGRLTNDNGVINLNLLGANLTSKEELSSLVFPDIQNNFRNAAWLRERAILAPINDDVRDINASLLAQIPGNSTTYRSIDTVSDNLIVDYPLEFIHTLTPSGFPSHILELKCGVPVMLLRNLDPPKLCNGTRLIIKQTLRNIIEAEIIGGKFSGETVFIPRIPLITSDAEDGLEFKRLQFPIQLSFSMTINKAQGQTFSVAGIDLTTSCFSHGQLYVACSRVGSARSLYIAAPEHRTKNVVYSEALR